MAVNGQTRPRTRRQPNRELIALRVNRGWSRRDLEDITGVSRETIRIAELGFVPGPRIQFRLSSAYGKQPLEIWPIQQQRLRPLARPRAAA